MEYWMAEHADAIFYGLLVVFALAEVVLRLLLRLPSTHVVLEYIDSGLIALILALIVRTFILQTFLVPSGSMENTLLVGDHLIVNKFLYGTQIPFTDKKVWPLRQPRRGDVIVFRYPKDTRRDFVKRCIGLPGDVVEVRNKALYVNGREQDESYVRHGDLQVIPVVFGSPRDFYGPVTVPAGEYFMMGDNRDYSADSRFWGFLPAHLIQGKAWVIYWPLERWKNIR
jgi:signal peptidase I